MKYVNTSRCRKSCPRTALAPDCSGTSSSSHFSRAQQCPNHSHHRHSMTKAAQRWHLVPDILIWLQKLSQSQFPKPKTSSFQCYPAEMHTTSTQVAAFGNNSVFLLLLQPCQQRLFILGMPRPAATCHRTTPRHPFGTGLDVMLVLVSAHRRHTKFWSPGILQI